RAVQPLARGFSRQHRITNFPTTGTHHVSPSCGAGFTWPTGYTLTPPSIRWHGYLPASPHHLATTSSGPLHPPPGHARRHEKTASGGLVSLIHHGRDYTGTGISTRCPSTTPVGLALGPDSPWED